MAHSNRLHHWAKHSILFVSTLGLIMGTTNFRARVQAVLDSGKDTAIDDIIEIITTELIEVALAERRLNTGDPQSFANGWNAGVYCVIAALQTAAWGEDGENKL